MVWAGVGQGRQAVKAHLREVVVEVVGYEMR